MGIDTESAGLSAGEGTTLLAGTSTSAAPRALSPLAQMPVGARVYVTDEQGRRSDFVVSSLQQYSKVALPARSSRPTAPASSRSSRAAAR
ncbi:hypothetical protein [Janibacter melonis]|uniref:hypothetical protein n=1 Tax=Janibacter melonis TaxID=262209 RepID=UPI002095E317|nr:hypothetical protein [Janibacter melonis]